MRNRGAARVRGATLIEYTLLVVAIAVVGAGATKVATRHSVRQATSDASNALIERAEPIVITRDAEISPPPARGR